MRVALHSVLVEGQEAGYEEAHRVVPEELMTALRGAGIREWTIWRSGRHLFHLVECDDFAAALERLAADPADARWQRYIGVYVDHFETTEGSPASGPTMALGQVWDLAAQAAGAEGGQAGA
ncbi:L-rhamnose mutarotase [Streptomyces sp. B6B3]|uniref:L-rhamnose mutarotase n=1 Tax=Streptomyces sp. B6B3 TaxID=3153570 RepID=UPI00325F16B4